MAKTKSVIYILIVIFMANLASAATIHGNVYDLSLKKLSNVKVEINTLPKQVVIAKNGSYSFNVPSGAYEINAKLMRKSTVLASVQENITVGQPGDYVLDLILFPDIEDGVEDINIDVNGEAFESSNKISIIAIAAILSILIAAFFGIYFIKKNKNQKQATKKWHYAEQKEETPKETESYGLNQIVKIIEQEGGRATQKGIRKQIPLSEAKISLMIAELEHKGIIDKIKKGRGNIIILKKR